MNTNPAESPAVDPTSLSPDTASSTAIPASTDAPAAPPAATAGETPLARFKAAAESRREAEARKGSDGDKSDRRDRRRRSEPKEKKAEAAPVVPVTVAPPSRRGPLGDDLEQEFAAAMADVKLDQLTGSPVAKDALETDSRARGTVVKLHGDNVFFALAGSRHEGIASVRQFREPPKLSDQFDVVIRAFNAEDGLFEVVVPGASVEVADWSDLTDGAIVEARITGANTGGLECLVNNIRGFIPASQIAMYRVENLGEFVNQKLMCVVTEANERRRNLVLSHRAILEREKEETRRKLFDTLEVGQTMEGLVRKVMDFGAFVELGPGVDGLVHISQLSWDHIKHPSEVVQDGQRIRVRIEKVDRQTGRIGLSYRDLLEHPWDRIEEKYPVGSVVTGVVSRIAEFGAFVKLAPGVEGLIHVSELAHHRVLRVTNIVKEGQELQAKVLTVDAEKQRMSLSLKAMLAPPPDAQPKPAEEPEEETPRELAVRPRKGPLKGGLRGKSGGSQFGLNW